MFDLTDLCIKVDECKLCYEHMLHDCWEGDVLKETTMANERWWKGSGLVALTSTEPVPSWFYLLKDQSKSLTLECISHQIGR